MGARLKVRTSCCEATSMMQRRPDKEPTSRWCLGACGGGGCGGGRRGGGNQRSRHLSWGDGGKQRGPCFFSKLWCSNNPGLLNNASLFNEGILFVELHSSMRANLCFGEPRQSQQALCGSNALTSLQTPIALRWRR